MQLNWPARKACMDCLAGQEKNMAALNIDPSTDERKEKIILTENDIPGAKIPRESLEHGGSVQPNNPCMPCGRDSYPSPHSFCNWRIAKLRNETKPCTNESAVGQHSGTFRTRKDSFIDNDNDNIMILNLYSALIYVDIF
jgi:hypothetical protein